MLLQKNHYKWLGLVTTLILPTIKYTRNFWGNPDITLPIEVSIVLIWLPLIIMLFILKYGEKEPFNSIGSFRFNLPTLGLSLIITILLCVTLILFGLVWFKLFHLPFTPELGIDKWLHYPLWAQLIFSITAGVTEETYFRGYGITRLQQLTKNKIISVMLPLMLFALGHAGYGTIRHVLFAFIFGIVLTVFYLKYRNLLANIIAHSLYDFLLFWFATNNPFS